MRNENIKKTLVFMTSLTFICAVFLPAVHSQLGAAVPDQSKETATTTTRIQKVENILIQKCAEKNSRQSNPNNPLPLDINPPNIHLPTGQVTMRLFTSPLSYFRNQLSNVPPGYEVLSGNYTGWCSDYAHYINLNTPYQIYLYSSYNASLPPRLYHQNWSKVNYILNHKIGNDWHQVQYAIVYILDFGNQGLNANGWAMVNASIQYGGSYIPGGGDIIAIIADPGVNIQRQIFELTVPTYALSVSTNGMGTVIQYPDQSQYTYGQVVQLTANPNPGWAFSQWSGDLSGTTNPTIITMTGNKTVTATFTQCIYSLSVSIDPVVGGSVDVIPDPPYYYGDVVTLSAMASLGYSFDSWSCDASGSSITITVTMDANKSVVAHFTQNVYTLTTTVDPSTGGSVSAVPSGPYHYGDIVTLTGTANPGYSFNYWSGDASGSSSVTMVMIDGDKTVTAHFTQNIYTLTITADPVTGGSIAADPSPPYHYDDVVTLIATANEGYSFDSWSGDASGSSLVITVTMNGNKTVTAHFTQNQYTLTITVDGQGTVIKDPDQTTYTYNTDVELSAVADPDWIFSSWSGDVTGNQTPILITVTSDMIITAHFIPVGGDTIPPVLQIVKPKNAIYIFNQETYAARVPIIVQMITIEVNASDNQSGINRVEFLIDGVVKTNDSSAPFSYDWLDAQCGNHTIGVTVYDNAGNSASKEVTVFKWRMHPILIIPLFILHLLKVRFGKDFWERFGFNTGQQYPDA
jgi:uncharacterized repeat protein (TIGR02543 family)